MCRIYVVDTISHLQAFVLKRISLCIICTVYVTFLLYIICYILGNNNYYLHDLLRIINFQNCKNLHFFFTFHKLPPFPGGVAILQRAGVGPAGARRLAAVGEPGGRGGRHPRRHAGVRQGVGEDVERRQPGVRRQERRKGEAQGRQEGQEEGQRRRGDAVRLSCRNELFLYYL